MISDSRTQGLRAAGFPVGCPSPGTPGKADTYPAPFASKRAWGSPAYGLPTPFTAGIRFFPPDCFDRQQPGPDGQLTTPVPQASHSPITGPTGQDHHAPPTGGTPQPHQPMVKASGSGGAWPRRRPLRTGRTSLPGTPAQASRLSDKGSASMPVFYRGGNSPLAVCAQEPTELPASAVDLSDDMPFAQHAAEGPEPPFPLVRALWFVVGVHNQFAAEREDDGRGVGALHVPHFTRQPFPQPRSALFAGGDDQFADALPIDLAANIEAQERASLGNEDDVSLILVEPQPSGPEPCPKVGLDLLCVFTALAHRHVIVGIPHQHRAPLDRFDVTTDASSMADPGRAFHHLRCHVQQQRADQSGKDGVFGPGALSRIRQFMSDTVGGQRLSPGFPAAFRPLAFACRTILSCWGIPPSSRSAYQPAFPPSWTPDGVSTFHTYETQPGRAPSLSRGRWCLLGREGLSRPTSAHADCQPLPAPLPRPITGNPQSRDVIDGSPNPSGHTRNTP